MGLLHVKFGTAYDVRDGSGEHGPSATWATSDASSCKLALLKLSARVK